DHRTQVQEPAAFAAQHPPQRPFEAANLGLQFFDQVQGGLGAAGTGAATDDLPGAIDRLPRLDRQRRPRRPGIVARHREAAADRARILLAQRQEAADVERAWRFAAALE